MDPGIGRYGGADVDPYGRRIDELYVLYAIGLYFFNVVGQLFSFAVSVKTRYQALQNEGGLPGSRDSRDDREPSPGDLGGKGLYGVDRLCLKADPALREQFPAGDVLKLPGLIGKIGPYHRIRTAFYVLCRSAGDDLASLCAGVRTHLDDPVGLPEDLSVMVHQKDGVAVPDQIVHDAGEPRDVGRMKADGRFVQHVEHSCSAVPHRPRQLHPLPFAGGKGRGGPVQGQISQSQLHEPRRRLKVGAADAFRHVPHLLRQGGRHFLHPFDGLLQGHRAGLIE